MTNGGWKSRAFAWQISACVLVLATAGCMEAPGKPKLSAQAQRPEEVVDFPTLYKNNCAGCHGEQGRSGAAVSLSNGVYVAYAGEATMRRITAEGVHGTMMPAFASANGGTLTDKQVAVLAHGMVERWGKGTEVATQAYPLYASSTVGNPVAGEKFFGTFCARCHGSDGAGLTSRGEGQSSSGSTQHLPRATGSIVDPSYLALLSDQSLRSTIIAGVPEEQMPDWRSDASGPGSRAMTDQEITDTVAWLASHRIATPGQPYQPHP